MSLSDFSDLTDLSSDEDDVPLSQKTYKKAAPAKKTAKEYKISNVLRPPRTTQYTAKSLYDQIIDNSIDLDPEYQRDVVWAESKQSGLIDSILRNYYMPPIIFAVSIADDGSELRTCIDGKQRLTSIQRFTNEKLWFKAGAPKQRRKLLPKNLMTQFANKQVVCVEYHDLNEDQEREIFQRVQLGVALTPAGSSSLNGHMQRMQAIVGPWPSLIREIQSQVLGENGFQGYLDWGHARGRDFQCLASIVYLIDNLPKQSFPGAPQLEKWIQRTDSVPAKLKAELTDTFRIFVTLARDTKYSGSLHKPTRVSPIEFVMIGVLIYLQRSALSLTQLSSAVEKMRADVRAKHVDIRANTRITKDMMGFITKKIKISQLRNDGDDKPAANKLSKRTASKRKRSAAESSDVSDGSEDESSKPPTRKATNPKPVKSTPSTTSSKIS
ncbi:hypothetical protein BJ138DRAFT_1008858 [Hygrophoropsis aurantiaca]|uniref:Uncharacterized protein n=1 Tax=Hygrophoropsis aurantiaca TaxID=72124 RepID=A0ACB8ACI0_9AGAM|nr:hypothetical protein BJ138DRAFT_1008858 [Hygrophoropsis aurantiaca]